VDQTPVTESHDLDKAIFTAMLIMKSLLYIPEDIQITALFKK